LLLEGSKKRAMRRLNGFKTMQLWVCKSSKLVVLKLHKPEEGSLSSAGGPHGSPAERSAAGVWRESARKGDYMQVPVEPVFTLIMGILILLVPRLLNYFVAIYLIIIGILGLLPKVHL
jgi:hypothetical protein